MPKKNFFFHYGAMDAGKTLDLMKARHNYVKQGKRVTVAKYDGDLKGADSIETRVDGFPSIPVDALIGKDDEPYEKLLRNLGASSLREVGVSCTFFDEVQFLSPEQVEDIYWNIARGEGIAVMAYGLSSDFTGHPFPGSAQAFARADIKRELVTVCRCESDSAATYNTRYDDGVVVFNGAQVAIDGVDNTYESLCHSCYSKELLGAYERGQEIAPILQPALKSILKGVGVRAALTTTDKQA